MVRDRASEMVVVSTSRHGMARLHVAPGHACQGDEEAPSLDLAILDYQMPDGDIGQLVERLRAVRPALRLIGNSSENRRREFSERGIVHFLDKPWKIEALVHAMRD
mgnify:CR=1 FL=1